MDDRYEREEAKDALGNQIKEGRWYLRERETRLPSLCFIKRYDESHGGFWGKQRVGESLLTLEMLRSCRPMDEEDLRWAARNLFRVGCTA